MAPDATPDDQPQPPNVVPGDDAQPSNRPLDAEAVTEPLPEEGGGQRRIAQENVGPDNELGSGEWPDPPTPPTGPSAGVDDADAEPSMKDKPDDEIAPGRAGTPLLDD